MFLQYPCSLVVHRDVPGFSSIELYASSCVYHALLVGRTLHRDRCGDVGHAPGLPGSSPDRPCLIGMVSAGLFLALSG